MEFISKKFGKMGSYNQECYVINNNLIAKRPPVGYETKADREYMAQLGISEYQVFFKEFLIGEVYFQDSLRAWIYKSTEQSGHDIIGQTNEKGFAVQRLYERILEAEKCQSI